MNMHMHYYTNIPTPTQAPYYSCTQIYNNEL